MFRRSHGPVVLSLILIAGIVSQPSAALGQTPSASLPETLKPSRTVVRLIWGKNSSFDFAGNAGQVITLRVNSKSPGLDPYVCFFDPENRVEASDDDGGKRGNSLIQNHSLKQSGRYTVIVGLENKVQGKVEILLESAASPTGKPALGPRLVASSSQLSCEAGSQSP
jgi:hypothetical protein